MPGTRRAREAVVATVAEAPMAGVEAATTLRSLIQEEMVVTTRMTATMTGRADGGRRAEFVWFRIRVLESTLWMTTWMVPTELAKRKSSLLGNHHQLPRTTRNQQPLPLQT